MKRFAQLFHELDQTTKTNAKVAALERYFNEADDHDKLWTIALLSGRRPKRTINSRYVREWATELSGLPQWLFEESYSVVGDMSETLSLIFPDPDQQEDQSLHYWIDYLVGLKELEEAERKAKLFHAWQSLGRTERFLFNKLTSGAFRFGVSQKLMVKGLAKATGIDENTLAHRIMGNWTPDEATFQELILEENDLEDASKPYPFYLAYAIDDTPEDLSAPDEWLAERKWDGIRGQLIFRKGALFVWSRGEELVTDKFPEFQELVGKVPEGTVIDGEIMPYKEGVLPFNILQKRIGRKNLGKKILVEAPVVVIAYDVLEWEGQDIRNRPLTERRAILEVLAGNLKPQSDKLLLSEQVPFKTWEELAAERQNSREQKSEGLMLKRKTSTYKVGRKRGDWWKWKVDPLTIDAVLIYAMRGHGRRANLYTDYTFALWQGNELVTFAKAYSGLTDAEIREVDRFVKQNTLERFGPVRQVTPQLVFEIAFEGVAKSTRHKSGVSVRFPRIHRWRKDKTIETADRLETLLGMVE